MSVCLVLDHISPYAQGVETGGKISREETGMESKQIAFAAIGALLCLSVAQVAGAMPPLPAGPLTEDKLRGWCNEHGGAFFGKDVPTNGNVYACLLPDGTLIACGGVIPMCTQSRRHEGVGNFFEFKSIISAMDQQSQAIKNLEDKVKALEDKLNDLKNNQR
jgi:hypothetical protein